MAGGGLAAGGGTYDGWGVGVGVGALGGGGGGVGAATGGAGAAGAAAGVDNDIFGSEECHSISAMSTNLSPT